MTPGFHGVFTKQQSSGNCCFAKNSMKPRGGSLNSMNYIYIYIDR